MKINLKMIFNMTLTIALIQLLLISILVMMFEIHIVSILIGSLVAVVNFGLLAILWHNIIYKKRVASTLVIVVIKYGILVYIFSQLPQWRWIHQNHLVFGVLISPISYICGGFLIKKLQ